MLDNLEMEENVMRFLIIFCLVVIMSAIVGCTSSKSFVLLRHPVTNMVVECPGESGISTGTAAEMKSCVDSYKQTGYEEVYSY